MSLIKQLWLAIAVVMTLAFGMSLIVSVYSARHYLQQQLQLKNIDNATSLALSLSQMEKDPVSVELQVAAQFDAGHYRYIRIVSPKGDMLIEKTYKGPEADVPRWFVSLFPIQTQPGKAQVQDGWKQYGALTLASHDSYAYQSLWDGTEELLMWFLLGSLVTGVLGTWAVKIITRPLSDVVEQAHGIAERRFMTITEPRTPELRSVVRAMNDMVLRLKTMFSEEAARLDTLRKKVNRDAVTGLSSREYFLSHLREVLMGDQFGTAGSLVMVRLSDLAQINSKLGGKRTDELLQTLGKILYESGEGRIGQRAGRLKGPEFAIICPTFASPEEAAKDIHGRLHSQWLPQWVAEIEDLFHVAAVPYVRDQTIGQLLSQADEALARAQGMGPNSMYASSAGNTSAGMPAEQWRTLLTEAVSGGKLQLAFYPVVSGDGSSALHQESVIRLQGEQQGTLLAAGDFMPMAAQLNLTAPIDLGVVRLAIAYLAKGSGNVAVNLSAETLGDYGFRSDLIQLLKSYPAICKRLLFEVPEYGVFRQFDAFKDLAQALKALGCQVGIEYFGQRFAESDKLTGLGLDYIKVHPTYVRGIGQNTGNQEFLKGVCKMAHALGIQIIALGVESEDDLPLLASLGFDGATGPGIGKKD